MPCFASLALLFAVASSCCDVWRSSLAKVVFMSHYWLWRWAVLLFLPKFRVGHPEHYFIFIIQKNIFWIKVPKNISFTSENRTGGELNNATEKTLSLLGSTLLEGATLARWILCQHHVLVVFIRTFAFYATRTHDASDRHCFFFQN